MVLAWSVDRLNRSLTGLLELLTELNAKQADRLAAAGAASGSPGHASYIEPAPGSSSASISTYISRAGNLGRRIALSQQRAPGVNRP
jgi:hypothetical protein